MVEEVIPNHVYMKVTMDKYELPLAVADSVVELSRLTGGNKNTISACIHNAKVRGCRSKYIKVVFREEDEDEENGYC